mgnify:CR=1 FL=1
MTDLTPNHPAVEVAAREIYVHDAPSNDPQTWPPTPDALADDYRGAAFATLTAALPHLTADDLRNTPAGRKLMAEAWDALIESMSASGEFHDVDLRTMQRLNPYLEDDE